MTIAVAGLWELGWSAPLTEADLWSYPIQEFGVDEWHMAPISGISITNAVREHSTPGRMVDCLRDRFTLVFVTEDAETELADLAHPEDACYCFGKANWSPFMNLRQSGDLEVRLKTVNGSAGLWPHQCMVTVLWHRGLQWR